MLIRISFDYLISVFSCYNDCIEIGGVSMLKTLALILLVIWIGGLVLNIAAGFIHFVLVLAIISFVVDLVRGRR